MKAVKRCFFVFGSIPDLYKTQEMCDRVNTADPSLTAYCLDKGLFTYYVSKYLRIFTPSLPLVSTCQLEEPPHVLTSDFRQLPPLPPHVKKDKKRVQFKSSGN